MIVICRYVTRVSSYMKCKMVLVTQFHVLFLYKVEHFVLLHYRHCIVYGYEKGMNLNWDQLIASI